MVTRVPKGWGYEDIIHNDDKYCGKLLHLNAGWTCSDHFHIKKTETFYVLKGCMKVYLAKDSFKPEGARHPLEEFWVYPEQVVEVAPFKIHSFSLPAEAEKFYSKIHQLEPLGYCEFIEFSTQHFDNDSYRFRQSRRIEG